MQRTYQIYATAAQANAAQVQIWNPGRITGVFWAVQMDFVADNSQLLAELSMQALSQVTTNDAQGIISTVAAYGNLVTSGMVMGAIHVADLGLDIPVNAGQIIYLNTGTTTATGYFKALIRVSGK